MPLVVKLGLSGTRPKGCTALPSLQPLVEFAPVTAQRNCSNEAIEGAAAQAVFKATVRSFSFCPRLPLRIAWFALQSPPTVRNRHLVPSNRQRIHGL